MYLLTFIIAVAISVLPMVMALTIHIRRKLWFRRCMAHSRRIDDEIRRSDT